MPSSVNSVEDIVNLALAKIGWRGRIGSIWEGSDAAKLALNVYAETRDELLRDGDWGFAERNTVLTPVKTAPAAGYMGAWTSAYPPIPWTYEALWPSDCLKVRAIKPVPIFQQDFDPQPNVFSVDNDNSLGEPCKVILYNVRNAVLVYSGQVTNPADWESDFVDDLTAEMAKRLGPALVGLDSLKYTGPQQQQADMVAKEEIG